MSRDPVITGDVTRRERSAERAWRMQRHQGNAATARRLGRNERDLTPVIAPTGGPRGVQRFLGGLWKGAKKVGKKIGSAAKAVGGAVVRGVTFGGRLIIARLRDMIGRAGRLAQTLLQALPVALTLSAVTRLPWLLQAAIGIVQVVRKGGIGGFARWLVKKLKGGLQWAGELLVRVFDFVGGPEQVQLAMGLLRSVTTPLLPHEIKAASSVLGPGAIAWDRVRIAQGGLLELIFLLNRRRAFTTFHTINMPVGQRDNLGLMVHELTHVYQFERVGSVYMIGAIHAQATLGDDVYKYYIINKNEILEEKKVEEEKVEEEKDEEKYKDDALATHRLNNFRMKDFNREWQAQIAQDYYLRVNSGKVVKNFELYIDELRRGDI